MSSTILKRHLIISGRVQGVGFRYFMMRNANELGITGWVRNRADGTVEAAIAGTPQAVEQMIERAQRGPPHSRVTAVRITETAGEFAQFDLRPTV